eukprot:5072356-Prymnesium_polylepis.1
MSRTLRAQTKPERAQTTFFTLIAIVHALVMRQSNYSSWALAARIGPHVTAPLLDDARYPRVVAPTCT